MTNKKNDPIQDKITQLRKNDQIKEKMKELKKKTTKLKKK